jgi:ADP-ribosylation factor-like protein 13B
MLFLKKESFKLFFFFRHSIMTSEQEARLQYCKEKNVHHLFELLATKVLHERPANIFSFLREQLTKIEESEAKQSAHDPSKIRSAATDGGLLKITLGIFGLDNAGKTAILSAMGGEVDPNTTPTVGFSPTHFQTEKHDICIFDLGGGKNFRGIWNHYYHDCHGYIYVVDSSDDTRAHECVTSFTEFAENKHVRSKPILIFANKKDLPTSKPPAYIETELLAVGKKLGSDQPFKVVHSCAIKEDPAVEAGVEWILATVESHYAQICKKLKDDAVEVQAEKKRKLAEQQARVEANRKQQA